MSALVLIVDDSITVCMDLANAFESIGWSTCLCRSLAEARAAIAEQDADLLVLDVRLPDGDGLQLLCEVRETPKTATLPVMMLSTEVEAKDRSRGLSHGADDYVGKPYDTDYVLNRARELVQQRGRRDAEPRRTTLLVIDDSRTFREELRSQLEQAGYCVITAADGPQGLRLATIQRPDAIVVDNMMPEMDGPTVIRKLRLDAGLRGTPCLLLTASEDCDAETRALEAGADAFARKESDCALLLARLSAMLRSARGERISANLETPRRILTVDDSPTYLHRLADTLREDRYDVLLAHSGEEALELLGVQRVDCVLLDLMMPGMGGKEACRRIKSDPALRDTPLIMLTGHEDRSTMIEALGTGADDYIFKSGDIDVLRARVRAQIRRKQFEDEQRKLREELVRSEVATAEARAARDAAEARAALAEELARKNRELEAFCYSVSHDLRTPLQSVCGYTELLLAEHAQRLDDVGRRHLTYVSVAAERMNQIIDDLLNLSRVGVTELKRELVDLSELAQRVLSDLRAGEAVADLRLEVEPGMHEHADPRLMRILLENLLGNALKFSSKTEHPQIRCTREPRDGTFVYAVRDNGAGFDSAQAGRLFEPFCRLHSQSEFPGTGVGLATVRRIVERHGGRLWAEGEPGRGAAIFFTLPQS
jgi:DNA-binding response OmpR family regulator